MLPANSAIKRPLDRLQSADLISAWPLFHGNSLPPVRRRAFRPPQIPPPPKVRKTQLSAQSQFKCRAILLNLLPASLAIKCKTTRVLAIIAQAQLPDHEKALDQLGVGPLENMMSDTLLDL